MLQTLHIFGKDVRRCWPYLAAVLPFTAVYSWREAMEGADSASVITQQLLTLFSLAATASWWLAISAAVHGESLVGDRQFWLTRPYSWRSLLGAKLLFLGAFLALPMLLSDCWILAASGFSLTPLIPSLLLRQCEVAATLVLPFLIAALTRNTRDFALAGVGYCVYFLFGLAAIVPLCIYGANPPLRFEKSWLLDAAPWLLCVAGLYLAAWQFPRRGTALMRTLAIALGAVLPVLTISALYSQPDRPPFRLLPQDPRYPNIAVEFAPRPTEDHPGIPVRLSGWPRELLTYQRAAVSLLGPKGDAAVSNSGDLVPSTDGREWLVFRSDEMERAAAVGGWKVRLEFDLVLYERQATVNLSPGGGWISVPRLGNVRLLDNAWGGHVIFCTALSPLEPEWAYRFDSPGFFQGITPLGDGAPALVSPLLFKISPVFTYPVGIGIVGSSGVFTVARQAATIRRHVNLPPIRLADYEAPR